MFSRMRMLALGTVACVAMAGCVTAQPANPYPPPPPVRVEAVPPPPRATLAWQPGHWHWNGGGYVWLPGHYVERIQGARWIPTHWNFRGGGWAWVPGHWG